MNAGKPLEVGQIKSEVRLPDRGNSIDQDSEEMKHLCLDEQILRVAAAESLSSCRSRDSKGSESLTALARC